MAPRPTPEAKPRNSPASATMTRDGPFGLERCEGPRDHAHVGGVDVLLLAGLLGAQQIVFVDGALGGGFALQFAQRDQVAVDVAAAELQLRKPRGQVLLSWTARLRSACSDDDAAEFRGDRSRAPASWACRAEVLRMARPEPDRGSVGLLLERCILRAQIDSS